MTRWPARVSPSADGPRPRLAPSLRGVRRPRSFHRSADGHPRDVPAAGGPEQELHRLPFDGAPAGAEALLCPGGVAAAQHEPAAPGGAAAEERGHRPQLVLHAPREVPGSPSRLSPADVLVMDGEFRGVERLL